MGENNDGNNIKHPIVWDLILEELLIHSIMEKIYSYRNKTQYYLFCPNCLSVIQEQIQQKYIFCPICHKKYSYSMLNYLREEAYEVIHFGYLYRTYYEEDLSKYGEVRTRYCLTEPTRILVYLGGIILSGILGGLAYEQFKYIVKKVENLLKNNRNNNIYEEWRKLMENMDEDELKKLYQYVSEYYHFKLRLISKFEKNKPREDTKS